MEQLELKNFRSCNRHFNCDEADKKYKEKYPNEKVIPYNIHCYDDECEDCFGN